MYLSIVIDKRSKIRTQDSISYSWTWKREQGQLADHFFSDVSSKKLLENNPSCLSIKLFVDIHIDPCINTHDNEWVQTKEVPNNYIASLESDLTSSQVQSLYTLPVREVALCEVVS